jgi:tRNA (cytidine/uridine-2'-O-)-methyltransferase
MLDIELYEVWAVRRNAASCDPPPSTELHNVRLALFQPDIAPNMGAAIRLTACLGVGLDVIEPCGFPISDKALRRSAMDYSTRCSLIRHLDFAAFVAATKATNSRIIAIETQGAIPFTDFEFCENDVLMLGRETLGTPTDVMAVCDAVVVIPMATGNRSLNVTISGAIVLTEALRQTGQWGQVS